jgi:ABC-type transport system involved in cytochrome c biogenesis permease component
MLLGMFLIGSVILLMMSCLGVVGCALSVASDSDYKLRHKVINTILCVLFLMILIPVLIHQWEITDWWLSTGRFN